MKETTSPQEEKPTFDKILAILTGISCQSTIIEWIIQNKEQPPETIVKFSTPNPEKDTTRKPPKEWYMKWF